MNGTITITEGPEEVIDANKQTDKKNKGVIFKNRGPFIYSTSEINNT